VQRRLHDANERSAKGETENHRHDQSDRHFHDRPPQVFEMFEKGFGRFAFRQLAKLEDIAQRHFYRCGNWIIPFATKRAHMLRVLASRMVSSAIMAVICPGENSRHSRIISASW